MNTLFQTLVNQVNALRNVPQRPDYHPEGDTYRHVAVVWHRASQTGNSILMMSALFHDIGKVETFAINSKTGHPTAYGHEAVSAHWVNAYRVALSTGSLSNDDWNAIQYIVAQHMRMKQVAKGDMSRGKVDQMQADAAAIGPDVWDLLVQFTDLDSMVDWYNQNGDSAVDLAVKEFEVWFNSVVQQAVADSPPSDGGDLFIVRGVPGSGKSTVAEMLAVGFEEENVALISTDDEFMVDGEYKFDPATLGQAHVTAQRRAREVMRQRLPRVIVHNTFTTVWEMLPYLQSAWVYGYRVFSLVTENRHGGVNVHGVPIEKVREMRKRMRKNIVL